MKKSNPNTVTFTQKRMKCCIEHGLDFGIYRLGPRRIKNMIRRKFGIELEIEGKDLHTITKEAQEIVYI